MPKRRKPARAADNARIEFIYGRLSVHDQNLEVMSLPAVLQVLQAKACTTWGEYAKICGLSWESMVEDWGDEISQLTRQEDPTPEAPFSFSDVWGPYYVGDLLPNPSAAAYDDLRNACIGLDDDPRLAGLQWSHGSPAGHICSLTVKHDEDIRLLEMVLREEGYTNFTFRRDDALLAKLVE